MNVVRLKIQSPSGKPYSAMKNMKFERSSGVLMPIFSLPSPYGIGTLGRAAYEFVDFLAEAGQRWWQILPLSVTGYGDSPYSPLSTFAGNPYFIDLDMLIADGLLTAEDVSVDFGGDCEYVDYGLMFRNRLRVLRRTYERGREIRAEALAEFCHQNPWVEDFALFMAAKAHFGMKSWCDWEDDALKRRESGAVVKYRRMLAEEIELHCFIQMLFFEQWSRLKRYANDKGIRILGDLPIYVAMDSADVWLEPEQFLLDGELQPTVVAGVPPDAFTEDGQLWGNPIYDWERMRSENYEWWERRLDGASHLYDALRIDHFRGVDSYWAVPAGDETAKDGTWRDGPGLSLVVSIKTRFADIRFIAEDLGLLTDRVRQLVKDSGFPGMKVLEFAFDARDRSAYLPEYCNEDSVCYLGTHDNDTVRGWESSLCAADRAFAQDYMNITEDEGWCWGMIRTGMNTRSCLFVAQMQDILELDTSARINIPGTDSGNWRWRMRPDALSPELVEKLRRYTTQSGRIVK